VGRKEITFSDVKALIKMWLGGKEANYTPAPQKMAVNGHDHVASARNCAVKGRPLQPTTLRPAASSNEVPIATSA